MIALEDIDIERTYNFLKSFPPIPVRVWFIDRPRDYYRVVGELESINSLNGTATPFLNLSVQIVEWQSRYHNPETEIVASKEDDLSKLRIDNYPSKTIYPWICNYPGVWVEWNNGQFTTLEL